MTRLHASTVSPVHPPLAPGARDARDQLLHELAKAQYAGARPNWFEQRIQDIVQWFQSLFNQVGVPAQGVGSTILTIVIIVLAVAALTIAFLVFGLPRINRRSRAANALFGEEDDRDAAALRRAAEQAAAAGDYSTAIVEGFRAIARGLAERVVVTTFPGTTAHTFGAEAARAFPDSRAALTRAADAFDGVRYLGDAGSAEDWQGIRALDRTLQTARPLLEEVPV